MNPAHRLGRYGAAVSSADAPFPGELRRRSPIRPPRREPTARSREFEPEGSGLSGGSFSRPREQAQQRPRPARPARPARPDGGREGGGSCLARITLPDARSHSQRFGASQGRRDERLQHGTWALRESIESPETFLTDDRTSIVAQNHDVDFSAVTGERFVNRVVDDLGHEMMQTPLGGVADVHPGPFANRFESFENLDGLGAIAVRRFFICHRKTSDELPFRHTTANENCICPEH